MSETTVITMPGLYYYVIELDAHEFKVNASFICPETNRETWNDIVYDSKYLLKVANEIYFDEFECPECGKKHWIRYAPMQCKNRDKYMA